MIKRFVVAMVVCALMLAVLPTALASEYATTMNTRHKLSALERDLVDYLNEHVEYANDINVLIGEFYSLQNEEELSSLFVALSKAERSGISSREYNLKNRFSLRFYDDGTFCISDSPIVMSTLQAGANSLSNWETGRITVTSTHYGWFGVSLYSIISEGQFTFTNGALNAYTYGGNIVKHFSGGFFTVRNLTTGAFTEAPYYFQPSVRRGEFYTQADMSLGLTIQGIGYEVTHVTRGYAYIAVDINTGQVLFSGNDYQIN